VGGLEGAVQLGDLLAVAALELGKLAGERGDDVAGLVRPGAGAAVAGGGASLLGAQLLDALPDGRAALEEVQRHGGGRGQAAEGDRLAGAQHLVQWKASDHRCGGMPVSQTASSLTGELAAERRKAKSVTVIFRFHSAVYS
jgi:hypothetical protein